MRYGNLMRYKLLLTFLMSALIICGINSVSAAEDTIAVGLYYGTSALQEAAIVSGDGLYVNGESVGTAVYVKMQLGNSISVYDEKRENVLIAGGISEPLTVTAGGNILKIKDVRYRGALRLVPENGAIKVINDIQADDYIKGVLPKEVSASWPQEALKAQAVISRTIVYSTLKDKHKNLGFDACATTNCQVYNGYDVEQPSTNDAVDSTKGMIVKYNGKAADTLFSAGNGGYVEASENVWSSAVPYLTSFKDEYEQTETVKGLIWSVSVTAEEIAEAVVKCGGDVGNVTGVTITKTAPSGRVLELRIDGTSGSYTLEKANTRSFLGLRSQLYTVTAPSEPVYAADGNGIAKAVMGYAVTENGVEPVSAEVYAADENGTVKLEKNENAEYVFSGRGYGHGVGLSQWGAYEMAVLGFRYDEILNYYYPGTVTEQK